MEKLGVLRKGTTPCERCGKESTTMVAGDYLCDQCGEEQTAFLQKNGSGIVSPFKRSLRQTIEALSEE
jgi:Zn finger protein HypA/HybF involved in hydrogenase expression